MKYGRYEVVKELGKGAMGIVYLAHDPNINRSVALKILRQDRVTNEDFLHRFLKEARAIGRLSHQNIVTVYDVGEDQGTVYIAMEYLEGRPLNTIAKENTLTISQILNIGAQVASALDYAHSKGIVHRDIKPQNIILTPQFQVKITDFGIAHIDDPEGAHQTQAGEILGTPNYMSPEQVMGKKVDGRSDIFSLGVILYELATGGRPFRGDNFAAIFKAIIHDEPEVPINENPDIPPNLSDSIMKSLNKEPEKRFQAGSEMADALLNLQEKGSENVPPIPPIQPAVRTSGRGKFLAVAVILIIIAAISAGAVYYFVKTSKAKTVSEEVRKAATNVQVQSGKTGNQKEVSTTGSVEKEEPKTAVPDKAASPSRAQAQEERKISPDEQKPSKQKSKVKKSESSNKGEGDMAVIPDPQEKPVSPAPTENPLQKGVQQAEQKPAKPEKKEPENKFQRLKRLQKEYNETGDPRLLEEIEKIKKDFYM